MARDRKRAKQRRERAAARADKGSGGLPPSQPVRTEVPGALDHASGEADEFEAAIVRGADGLAVPTGELDTVEDGEGPAAGSDTDLDGTDDLLQEGGQDVAGAGRGGGGGGGGGGTTAVAERPSGAPLRGGNRVIGFLRASWAELQRVQWPDRRQVTQATAVVLGFVAIAGAYLGLADYVAKEIVEYIL